jgi:hypothetical protein
VIRRRLRSKVRQVSRGKSTSQAKVVDVAPNRATVRLGGNGATLTMIPTAIAVKVGVWVIVDYSSGSPLVKASL